MSDRSPVAHPETACNRIEFDWGCSKILHTGQNCYLKSKKAKQSFIKLVHEVLGSAVLTLTVCQANTCRARQYMLAYMTLEGQNKSWSSNTQHLCTENKVQQSTVEQEITVTHTLIERCVGLFRNQQTHWSAIDFDGKYLKDEVLKNFVDGMVMFPKMEQVWSQSFPMYFLRCHFFRAQAVQYYQTYPSLRWAMNHDNWHTPSLFAGVARYVCCCVTTNHKLSNSWIKVNKNSFWIHHWFEIQMRTFKPRSYCESSSFCRVCMMHLFLPLIHTLNMNMLDWVFRRIWDASFLPMNVNKE